MRKGVTEFTEAQRATVELSRYRCFLLGLPQDLLGETPREIIDLLMARHVTLREAYDDETCGTLVRGTMEADLFDRSSLRGKLHSWLENGFSRFVLINSFLSGDASAGQRRWASPSAGPRSWPPQLPPASSAPTRPSTA